MNFKQTKEYVEKNKKLDIAHFDKVTEITNMIDYLNAEREKKEQEYADNEVHEISKFLAGIMSRKTILLKTK